jgi:hypothetical protein
MRRLLLLCACLAAPDVQAKGATLNVSAMLDAHNQLRAKHCAPPLRWSPKVAASAQKWADALRDRGCVLGHSGGPHGENLAAGTLGTLDESSVARMWYDEVKKFNFHSGGFSMKTGHFTQLVWKGTSELGCGRSQCNGIDIFICQYDPPGNVEGQYRENVSPSGCR